MINKQNIKQTKQTGFSLLEILVAMAIMAILGGIMAANFLGETDKARLQKLKGDIEALDSALLRYNLDNFSFPTTEQGLESLVSKPDSQPEPKNYPNGGYLKKLQNDPWGNPYQYIYPGENGQYDIYSLGADGQEGGEGPNADIGSWNVDDAINASKS
jgi:general secretion pathway protein G